MGLLYFTVVLQLYGYRYFCQCESGVWRDVAYTFTRIFHLRPLALWSRHARD